MADTIMGVLNLLFLAALAPTLWHQWRVRESTVPLTTSVPTTLALAGFVAVFASMGLWLATATDAVIGAMWAWIAAQRVVYGDAGSAGHEPPVERRIRRARLRLRYEQAKLELMDVCRRGGRISSGFAERRLDRAVESWVAAGPDGSFRAVRGRGRGRSAARRRPAIEVGRLALVVGGAAAAALALTGLSVGLVWL
ncbi:MAG: hypothetical protein QN194_14945 [Armatimonadota bacterium]|nr:hypothetical protein [Armatimonadota bacterium]